ncbi:SDR family NAD(P)-dependent oxidoreductase, partial [Staphylococcus epidermidis]|uniref:SDR family NAD(P)-dependent oxidoreductase n=1 Tax=Staphylococcus epidermidis TaxID=1282 RepID=UPI0011A1D440
PHLPINYLPTHQQDAHHLKHIIQNVPQKPILIPPHITHQQFNYHILQNPYHQLRPLHNLTLLPPHQLYQHQLSHFKTQHFTQTFQTNLYPLFCTLQKPLHYLQPRGSITTTSSLQPYNPSPILHHYAATKAAI